jgi:hypothetical protein
MNRHAAAYVFSGMRGICPSILAENERPRRRRARGPARARRGRWRHPAVLGLLALLVAADAALLALILAM